VLANIDVVTLREAKIQQARLEHAACDVRVDRDAELISTHNAVMIEELAVVMLLS